MVDLAVDHARGADAALAAAAIGRQVLASNTMSLLFLEALAALLIFVLIIWWTMFAGRSKGERQDDDANQ